MYVQPPTSVHDSLGPWPRHDMSNAGFLSQACSSAIGSAEFYDHAKTEQWNSSIIVGFRLAPAFPEETVFRG